VHTVRSQGGELTAERLAAAARAGGLDFIATTEHNTAEGHGDWGPLAGDDLLVILGQEVVTETGHWLALGLPPGQAVEWRYGIRDGAIGPHLDQVRRVGGLCVAAHPHAPYPGGEFMYPFGAFDALEVWNGLWSSDLPWNADNETALAEWGRALGDGVRSGRWLPAVGNSDVHLDGQLGTPQMVVLAEELSTAAILAAIRAGRSWIAGSAAVQLSLQVSTPARSAGMGERLEAGGAPALVEVTVGGVPSGMVWLHTDRGTVHRQQLPADGRGTVEWRTSGRPPAFVRVEVRHPGGHAAALTNPVILA
jgi:hypothetical protein